ncbi:n-terminal fungal transcription regulatory domain-containing [Trichoderma arundinaceum]|uniref:N-terminal fungal transcription regulatory domain-containing n=1 Tax=Trichoderma arundinaceum TaxID=490622 RepID=A0A395NLV9_TRIAR|nr:n-terminal fungal transcription regulatory domain-containing [Trichoderma arundinaceum]
MFKDDSRQIASEYLGGLCRYPNTQQNEPAGCNAKAQTQTAGSAQEPSNPILQGHIWHIYISPEGSNTTKSIHSDKLILQATEWRKQATVISEPMSLSEVEDRSNVSETIEDDSITFPTTVSPSTSEREFLDIPEHIQYMQIYVEEIAFWIDSFNKRKYFGQCLPYRALDSPLLLHSLLACGVRRLSHRHPNMNDIAAAYYSTANMQLFRYHENPERDMEECSVAALILKLYNVMYKDGPQSGGHSPAKLNSIISESQWNAASSGIGSACFWLNSYLDITHPMEQTILSEEMISLQLHHAREVCGIVAHSDDRCMGPVSIQALLIASGVLTDHKEQIEVLGILRKMKAHIEYPQQDTEKQLKAAWGWDDAGPRLPLSYDRDNEQPTQVVSTSTQTSTAISPQQPASMTNTPYTLMSMPRTIDSPEQPLPSFTNFGQSQQYGYRGWRGSLDSESSFIPPLYPLHR